MQILTTPANRPTFPHSTYDMVDWDSDFGVNEDMLMDGIPEEDALDEWV